MSIPGAASPLFLGAAVAEEAAYQIDRSLRFNSADSAYLNRTPSSAGNRKKWTWSGWVKRSALGSSQIIFSGVQDGNNGSVLNFTSADQINFFNYVGGAYSGRRITTPVYRDLSAWYHIVFIWDSENSTSADRIRLYVNGEEVTVFGTTGDPSSSDSIINSTNAHYIGADVGFNNQYSNQYLADVHFIDGQALAPTDFGEYDSNNNWNPKAFAGSYGTNGWRLDFSDNSSDQALGYDAAVTQPTLNPRGGMDVITYTGNGSTQTIGGLAFQPDLVWVKKRNGTTWHALVDSVRGTDIELFSNSASAESTPVTSGLTAFNSDGFTLGANSGWNANTDTFVAWAWKAGGPAVTNTNGSIDSQVSASPDYGFSVVTYTGTGSAQTVGHGLSSAPKMILAKNRTGSAGSWLVLLAEKIGHLDLTNAMGAYNADSGFFNNTLPTSSVFSIGSYHLAVDFVAYCWSEVSGFSKFGSYTGNGSSSGPTITTGFKPRWVMLKRTDSTGNWVMLDTGRDPTGANSLYADTSDAEYAPGQIWASLGSDGFQITATYGEVNASGGTYVYAAFADRPGNNWTPNNLIAEAGLETASQGMDVVTYTGNGSTQSISSLDFQPDLVWIKQRNSASDHNLFDIVRGVQKRLFSNSTAAEGTISSGLTSFDTNGWTMGSSGNINGSSNTYVAWCWKAGGTASSNTDGSITSSVSANDTYGFSVVGWEGNGSSSATVGHGLSSTPKWVIVKGRETTDSWSVHHTSLTSGHVLLLNSTGASFAASTAGGGGVGAPTSSTLTFVNGTSSVNNVNQSTKDFIAYCWSEVPGFSKFGSYTGNGLVTNGTRVITGFKPAFVLIKQTGGTSNWTIFDNARDGARLYPNTNDTEATSATVDLLDDGFQCVRDTPLTNSNGATYIYAAFADKPPGEIIDSLIDTPTNYEADSGNNGGNYATLNPLDNGGLTLTNGNLDATYTAQAWRAVRATVGVSSGKWYWEITTPNASTSGPSYFTILTGIAKGSASLTTAIGLDPNSWGYYNFNGVKYNNSSSSSYGSSWIAGDVIGVAFDADNGTLTFYKNNISQGTAYTGLTSGPYFPATSCYGSVIANINFGARPFAYTPPTGYKSLCTTNLTDPTIADGSTAMDVKLYTGNSGTQTISGLGFSPDLLWIKSRSVAYSHRLFDTVRGVTKALYPDLTEAEGAAQGTNENLTAFTSDGFSLGSASGIDAINNNNVTFAAWAWDGGTTTATNTDGSITSNIRANQSAGFSIISYTGDGSGTDTIGHGLNDAPSLVITKSRGTTGSWRVFTDVGGTWKLGNLNNTDAFVNATVSAPTSSVFSIDGNSNASTTHIAYCFAPVSQYSAFGVYTGNGSTDGPFVFTGFRPRWILIKNSSTSEYWRLYDTERSTENVMGDMLMPNDSSAEVTSSVNILDALSNGFKLRGTHSSTNGSGNTIIYAAFAEHPFKYARAR